MGEVLEKLVVEQHEYYVHGVAHLSGGKKATDWRTSEMARWGWLADDYHQACRYICQGSSGKERSKGGTSEPRKCFCCSSMDHIK